MIRTTQHSPFGVRRQSSRHRQPQRPLTFDVTSVKPNTSGEQGGSSRDSPGDTSASMSRSDASIGPGLHASAGIHRRTGLDQHGSFRHRGQGRGHAQPGADERDASLAARRSLQARRASRDETDARLRADARARPTARWAPSYDAPSPCKPPQRHRRPQSAHGAVADSAVGDGSLKGIGVTMTQLAAELPSATEGRYVVDRTGLSGTFDVTLTWNADALRPDDPTRGERGVNLRGDSGAARSEARVRSQPPIEVIVDRPRSMRPSLHPQLIGSRDSSGRHRAATIDRCNGRSTSRGRSSMPTRSEPWSSPPAARPASLSSRTLPGQSYSVRQFSASGVSSITGRPSRAACTHMEIA